MDSGLPTPNEFLINDASGKIQLATGRLAKTYEFSIKVYTEALANRGENQITLEGFKVIVECGPDSTTVEPQPFAVQS